MLTPRTKWTTAGQELQVPRLTVEQPNQNTVLVLLAANRHLLVDAYSIAFSQDGRVLSLKDLDGNNIAVFSEGQWVGAVRARLGMFHELAKNDERETSTPTVG